MLPPADPDVSAISLPPNMNVPKDFPAEAWSPSGEVRSYPDMMVNFPAAGFSMEHPPAEVTPAPRLSAFISAFFNSLKRNELLHRSTSSICVGGTTPRPHLRTPTSGA